MFCAYFLSAQNFVSTKQENKNVVLEEYTGIHCGYCPDGHKRSNDLAEQYPGDVVLINVHVGSFATPQTGDPDFRTSFGTALDNLADVRGYPAGSVNRRKFSGIAPQGSGSAMNRDKWASAADTVRNETSPVNVAVKPSLDISTRELTVDVEVYYTDDEMASENRLNVAILQDNIPGPQSTYANPPGSYNPDAWLPNGQYTHQHMLRNMLTGQWGEALDSTSKGAFFAKQYKWTVPGNINNVDVMLQNLRVAAFVTEGSSEQYEILTGVSEKVDIPASAKVDLSVSQKTQTPSDICAEHITPALEFTNSGSNTISSFDVSANINGQMVKKSFSGSLAAGEKTTLDWGNLNLPGGVYSLTFYEPKNINNGDLFDVNLKNSVPSLISGYSFLSGAITKKTTAYFENSLANGFALDASQNTAFKIYYSSNRPGANGSYGAVLFYLHQSWGVAGKPGHILLGQVDATKFTNPGISFQYAYSDGSYGGTPPQIAVSASTDCGKTWNKIDQFTAEETGQPAQSGQLYFPQASDYIWVGYSLEDYKDATDLILRVSGIPGSHGNALWIDEVQVSSEVVGIDEPQLASKISLFPNPANTQLTLNYNGNADITSLKIYNAVGQEVKVENNFVISGNTSIDVSDLTPGIYHLNLQTAEGIVNKQFVINR